MKCIIIGLGTYGRVMVDELSALGHEVIAADSDAGRVERVKDICDAAFQIDACDELALTVLPLKKVDVVIVAIGSNLGASVRVVALLKKLGVKQRLCAQEHPSGVRHREDPDSGGACRPFAGAPDGPWREDRSLPYRRHVLCV